MASSRDAEFKSQFPHYLGKPPTLLDTHEAVLGNHISMEEAQDLRSDYKPDEVLTNYRDKRTLGKELTYQARARARGSGAFNKVKNRNRMATKRAKEKDIKNAVQDFNPS